VQRGFSLVEAIIAVSIVVVALVPLAQLAATAVRNGFMARTRTTTTILAEQKMEELRALPWGALGATGKGVDYLDDSGAPICPGATASCDGTVYVRKWSAALSTFNNGVWLVQVEVSTVGEIHGTARLITARARKTP
jgi:prepilin-type N-terminal cleavage/methylation domain-containing protein